MAHKVSRLITLVASLLVLVALVAACASPTPLPPTATPVPPTKAPTNTVPPPSPTAAPTQTPVPPTDTPVPIPAGVTARQVQHLLAEKFNTADRDLTLWNIQPGLGTVMIEYGRRMALTHQAAQAEDWGMAQYQLKEATEIQEVGEITRPGKAELLKNFEHSYLDSLAQTILNKDKAAFNADFGKAIEGCNACHVATDHPYVVVQSPATSPQDFLKLAASESKAPEEKAPAATPTAAPDKPLTWAELYQMVDDAFNTADRQLTLWNIQPGLGTVMMEYGRRVALVRHAVDAGDWGMAQYQLKEATEIQEVGETTRAGKADLLKNFEHTYLDPLAQDIQDKNKGSFDADYSKAIDGCNACHQGTGHPYVRFQEPPTSPEPFLDLAASEPAAPEEASAAATAAPASYPAGNPTLEDASKLIEDRLNTVDRSLALWAIQPGLGTIMQEYGYRYALAWYAAEAGNWGMADYQLKEATEIQEVGETTRSGKADLLKSFEHTYLDPVIEAVKAQDKAAFESTYKAAIDGCNACHQGTGHSYVRYQMPPQVPADFLKLGEAAPATVKEEEQPTATSQPPAGFDAAAAYASKCVFCHGPEGSGGVANPNSEDGTIPALNTSEFAEEFGATAEIKDVILNGSTPEKAANVSGAPIGMPAFQGQFSDVELDALIAYIQGLSKK